MNVTMISHTQLASYDPKSALSYDYCVLLLTEGGDVVASHERESAFRFDGVDCGVPRFCVRDELRLPNVVGACVINDLKRRCLIGFETEDID